MKYPSYNVERSFHFYPDRHRIPSMRRLPNGLTHLPPVMARQQNPKITFLTNRRCVPTPEAVRLEPVLGAKANLDYVKPRSFAFELLA
jgi:hypothetical protein